jgi:hypothetical protein
VVAGNQSAMDKVTVRGSMTSVVVVMAFVVAGAVVSLFSPPIYVYVLIYSAGVVVWVVLSIRWQRQVAPVIRAAHKPGHPRPWIDVTWPVWTKLVVRVWIIIFATMVILLFLILLIAALVIGLS